MNLTNVKLGLIGIPSLFITILGSASILPFAILIHVHNPLLKVLWRCIAAIPFMVIVSVIELKINETKAKEVILLFVTNWRYVIFSSLSMISM